MLMEVTYEAIADSGLSMADLKGSKTGVYIGKRKCRYVTEARYAQ